MHQRRIEVEILAGGGGVGYIAADNNTNEHIANVIVILKQRKVRILVCVILDPHDREINEFQKGLGQIVLCQTNLFQRRGAVTKTDSAGGFGEGVELAILIEAGGEVGIHLLHSVQQHLGAGQVYAVALLAKLIEAAIAQRKRVNIRRIVSGDHALRKLIGGERIHVRQHDGDIRVRVHEAHHGIIPEIGANAQRTGGHQGRIGVRTAPAVAVEAGGNVELSVQHQPVGAPTNILQIQVSAGLQRTKVHAAIERILRGDIERIAGCIIAEGCHVGVGHADAVGGLAGGNVQPLNHGHGDLIAIVSVFLIPVHDEQRIVLIGRQSQIRAGSDLALGAVPLQLPQVIFAPRAVVYGRQQIESVIDGNKAGNIQIGAVRFLHQLCQGFTNGDGIALKRQRMDAAKFADQPVQRCFVAGQGIYRFLHGIGGYFILVFPLGQVKPIGRSILAGICGIQFVEHGAAASVNFAVGCAKHIQVNIRSVPINGTGITHLANDLRQRRTGAQAEYQHQKQGKPFLHPHEILLSFR